MSKITVELMQSYTDDQQKFVREIELSGDRDDGGWEAEHYHGRNFYEGPAVRCDDKEEVFAFVSVACQYDNMGLGWIVYPRR